MGEQRKLLQQQSIERLVASYLAAGGTDEHGIRATLETAYEEDSFVVGDEVVCAHGSVTGYIVAINGFDAVISWSCRGKSTEHLVDLSHVPHSG